MVLGSVIPLTVGCKMQFVEDAFVLIAIVPELDPKVSADWNCSVPAKIVAPLKLLEPLDNKMVPALDPVSNKPLTFIGPPDNTPFKVKVDPDGVSM